MTSDVLGLSILVWFSWQVADFANSLEIFKIQNWISCNWERGEGVTAPLFAVNVRFSPENNGKCALKVVLLRINPPRFLIGVSNQYKIEKVMNKIFVGLYADMAAPEFVEDDVWYTIRKYVTEKGAYSFMARCEECPLFTLNRYDDTSFEAALFDRAVELFKFHTGKSCPEELVYEVLRTTDSVLAFCFILQSDRAGAWYVSQEVCRSDKDACRKHWSPKLIEELFAVYDIDGIIDRALQMYKRL